MNINLEKAREYFSAHYEGTLDKGLAEAFERALRTDAQIQAEYRAFERLMSNLEALKSPAPEPVADLHEIISRRLDLHIHEQKRRTPAGAFGWWRSLALGGLATAALVMAVLQMRDGASGAGNATASIGSLPVASEKVELHEVGNGYQLEYSTKSEKQIVVRSADGGVLDQKTVKAGSFISPLSNPNEKAKLIQIDVEGESTVYVALPGSRIQSVKVGEGTVQDLALALAGFYRQPVMLTLGEDVKLKWSFEPGEAVAAAEKALGETKYSAQESQDGVLSIRSN